MLTADLILTQEVFEKILSHLLRDNPTAEEAAFCFVQPNESGELTLLDWYPVPAQGFDYYSLYHFELSQECQARIIKKAYDLKAKIVEFHSHPYPNQAEFSSSDRAGFREFVPHVWWRLKGGPYAAVVVAPGSFDSLIWTARPDVPNGILRIRSGAKVLEPTRRTYRNPMEVKQSC